MKALFSIAALALVSSSAFGSNIPTSRDTHLCTLHYTKVAYGKEVRSVMAHTGTTYCSSLSSSDAAPDWTNVQDIYLDGSQSAQAFTGKVKFTATPTAYERCKRVPVVQFWVNFTDGSSKIENVTSMQISQQWTDVSADPSLAPKDAVEAIQQWSQGQASNGVSCIYFTQNIWQTETLVDSLLN